MIRRNQILMLLAVILAAPIAGIGVTYLLAPQVLISLFAPPPPAPEPPPSPIKFTVESTEIGKYLDHPVARKWLDKYFPGFRNKEQIALTRRLTLPEVQQFFADVITVKALESLSAELEPFPALEPVVVYSTGQTELGRLLDDPDAKAIVAKHLPTLLADQRINMARPFTLVFLQAHIPDIVTDERCAAIDADFAALAEARAEEIKP